MHSVTSARSKVIVHFKSELIATVRTTLATAHFIRHVKRFTTDMPKPVSRVRKRTNIPLPNTVVE
jgi:hypothetical protein